jgi:hypothetical protein
VANKIRKMAIATKTQNQGDSGGWKSMPLDIMLVSYAI